MACPVHAQYANEFALSSPNIPKIMKAVRFQKSGKAVEELQLESDIPVPKAGLAQILIKVLTIGVNPHEIYQQSENYKGDMPDILGSDCAGVVVCTGSGRSKFKVGDQVFTTKTVTGSYAQYTVSEEAYTFPLHENLTLSQGAALGIPYFTAYKALFIKAECKPGETVLVHKAFDGIGVACCQIARRHGLRVIGTAGTDHGLSKVLENGAHVVFNHQEKDYINKIQHYVGDKGINVICEISAAKDLDNELSLLAKDGRLIEEYAEIANALYAGAEAGWIQPVITDEFPLAEAADAHRKITDQQEPTEGKIILSIC